MRKKNKNALLHITSQYVSSVGNDVRPRLGEYIARYPEYADDIADFSIYYHTVEQPSPEYSTVPQPLSEVSQSVLNCFLIPEKTAPPCTSLFQTITGQSLAVAQLARRLHLSADALRSLAQHRVVVESIPAEFYQQLSSILGYTEPAIRSYFTTIQPKLRKVAETPTPYDTLCIEDTTVGMSFRQLVEQSTHMVPDHRSYWLAILVREGL